MPRALSVTTGPFLKGRCRSLRHGINQLAETREAWHSRPRYKTNRIRPFVAFLYPLFFTSGIPALLYQVVWQRSLFTIYGTNTESATAVVAAFLLGLGRAPLPAAGRPAAGPPGSSSSTGVIEFVIGLFGSCRCRSSIG